MTAVMLISVNNINKDFSIKIMKTQQHTIKEPRN